MKYYKIELNGEDAYQKYKNDPERFTWVNIPKYFMTDNYTIYFTMYGLNRFVEDDYTSFLETFKKDDFDFKEINLETKDRNIVFTQNKFIVYKIGEDNLGWKM